MNRLREKTTATLLIAIFMISAFAVAYAADDYTTLFAVYEAQPTGIEDKIVIEMPVGFKLKHLMTISWSVWFVSGYPPHVDIILGTDIDGIENEDSLTAELAVNSNPGDKEWSELQGDVKYGKWLKTFELDTGVGDALIDGDTVLWVTRHGAGNKDAPFGTLDELKAGTVYYPDQETGFPGPVEDPEIFINGNVVVLRLEIEVDNWLGEAKAYVKDITYNTLQGQSTALELIVVPRIVRINVDRTSVSFGPMLAGVASPTETVVVRNDGNVHVDVTTSLDGSDAAFFDANMAISANLVDIAPAGTRNCHLVLTVPSGTVPDTYTATLVFEAVETP